MADGTPTLQSLVEELAQLRAALAAQNETIARQESIINSLQERMASEEQTPHAEAAPASVADDAGAEQAHSFTTSRRGLLRGAAAGAAAAAVAAVAVGGAEQAHASPLVNGSPLLLGEANTAEVTTTLTYDGSLTPEPILLITDGGNTSVDCVALLGTVTTGTGVQGQSNSGVGVGGVSDSGIGVSGTDATSGIGVKGYSQSGVAVFATGGSGSVGLLGASTDSSDIIAGGTGLITQIMQTSAGSPSGAFLGGESIRDSNGDLWLCVAPGTPGTWVKVAHLAPGATNGGAVTYLSKPIRLLDTRAGEPAASSTKGVFAAGSTHTIQVAGVNYNTVLVPAKCAGAIGNLTVIGDVGNGGYAALVPSGAGFTGTANLAFNAGQVVSNAYNVGLSAGGALDIILGPAASANVILDLFAIVS